MVQALFLVLEVQWSLALVYIWFLLKRQSGQQHHVSSLLKKEKQGTAGEGEAGAATIRGRRMEGGL